MIKLEAVLGFAFLVAFGTACVSPGSLPAHPEKSNKPAKNVILFIGDGMGVSTVTAMRIYAGQLQGGSGEEYVLPFEEFENVALVKTYNSNQQTPDSAGTASAMHTGLKTRAGVIGIGPEPNRGDCKSSKNYHLTTLGQHALNRDKAVGIVSTARLTHATPAAVFAHSPERDWEFDGALPEDAITDGCRDIARQLLDFPFNVAFGGGGQMFLPSSVGGKRVSEEDILARWKTQTNGNLVWNADQMLAAPDGQPLLGLFANSHMAYELDKPAESVEPTLAEMTAEAIRRLSNDEDGYYLMVEGGRIDHGHHMGRAEYALAEGKAFADAVATALELTDASETLILVTADHSHVFSIAGYPTRGNPILGLVVGNDMSGRPQDQPALALDGQPYTTLGYLNGPGAISGQRTDPDTEPGALQQSVVPTGIEVSGSELLLETHGGEDVALYGFGNGAHLVRGVIEQDEIFDIIMDAYGGQ